MLDDYSLFLHNSLVLLIIYFILIVFIYLPDRLRVCAYVEGVFFTCSFCRLHHCTSRCRQVTLDKSLNVPEITYSFGLGLFFFFGVSNYLKTTKNVLR